MAESITKRKSTLESDEKSVSVANSKDDDNLIQNWSLTFTEYAANNQYAKKPGSNNGTSEQTLENKNNQLIYKRPADGRGQVTDHGTFPSKLGHPERNREDIPNERTNVEHLITEKINVKLPQADEVSDKQSVSINGRSMNIGTSRDMNSERTRDKNNERYKKGESVSIRSKLSTASGKSVHRIHDDTEAVPENSQKEVVFQYGDFSKHSILPTIGARMSTAERMKLSETRRTVSGGSARKIGVAGGRNVPRSPQNVPRTPQSVSRPQQNMPRTPHNLPRTPPIQNGYGGKVQPIYVRLPGQRTGQMMFAEMNQQSGQVRIVGRDKEKEMLARLAWLLVDAGTSALRATFDSIHPPLNLREHFRQSHVKIVLQRLLQQAILNEKQWQMLYPVKKKNQSSQKYDSRTLIILLETICHLCPPYPHGWGKEPLPKDGSLSADIVRLQLLFQELARHEAIAGEAYVPWFIQIRDVIVRLGGPPIRIKIARIETEMINMDMQHHYLKTLRDTWHPDVIQKLQKVHELRTKTSNARKAYASSKGVEEGLSPEDRVTLKKTYKLVVETVLAEDVIDRLQQSQVIKFSDRQEVLSVSKKQERMQILLDKISDSRLPYALKALFDAMKFKYKKLYDHVMAIRKQTHKEGVVTTIDVSGIVQEALASQYKNTFSRVYPFPWSNSIHASVRDIYTPLEIVNSEGHKLHSSDLLPPPCSTDGRGSRILLEGSSGSGKSVLCAWLCYMWATQQTYFKHRYTHLLYLNASSMEGNIETAVYRCLFPDNIRVSVNEFWKMLENRPHEVLVIVDDYDKACDVDLSEVLSGTKLRESTVLVVVNPDYMRSNSFVPDTKWFNLGFNEVHIRRCFRTCVSLAQQEHDQFEKLYHLAGRETWALRPHLVNPMLAVTAFGVFYVLRKGTMLRDMKTTCDLLEKYGAAMATLYCRKQNIDIIGFEFPYEILCAIEELDRFAFRCLMGDQIRFTEAEILNETKNPIVLQIGAFNKFTQGSRLKFSCGISSDFLAARHIADMMYEDIETTILKNKMIKLHRYTQMMTFLCGQYREDTDTQVLQSIADQLAARNEYCIRGFYLPAPSISTPVDGEVKVRVPRGVLQDFTTSLECLSECPDRQDVIGTIAQALPQRLIIKADGMLTLKCVQGLSLTLEHNDCVIEEIELELHRYHHFQLPVFLQLATSIGKCSSVRSVKITWSSMDLMAKCLANIMEYNRTVDTLVLIEDQSNKPVHVNQISATTWEALQSACNNMSSVQQLSFQAVRVTAIVNHVLQYMPTSIAHVDLTGSALNLMCAGQIANYLHGNTVIRYLDLSHTKINSSEFVAIFQGMQMCESIQSVRVRGARLDRPCIIALSEYIKLTHSLEVLDLSDCELNTEMCTRLVAAIRQNRTLQKLVFNNTRITVEGRRVISKTKSKVQRVYVEGLVPIYL